MNYNYQHPRGSELLTLPTTKITTPLLLFFYFLTQANKATEITLQWGGQPRRAASELHPAALVLWGSHFLPDMGTPPARRGLQLV